MPFAVFTAALLLAFSAPADAQSAREITIKGMCQALQDTYEELTDQLPMQLDYATRLIGASAIHMGSSCYINIIYLLLDDPFIDEMVNSTRGEPEPLTRDEAITFLNRVEGRRMLESEAKLRLRDTMSKLLSLPGIKLKVRYETMGLIHPFTVELESKPTNGPAQKREGPSY